MSAAERKDAYRAFLGSEIRRLRAKLMAHGIDPDRDEALAGPEAMPEQPPWRVPRGRPAKTGAMRVLRLKPSKPHPNTLFHAVTEGLKTAHCGVKPGKDSEWDDEIGQKVTCSHCLEAIRDRRGRLTLPGSRA
jgi:hypothetical protein